jgi:hypothetical protein
MKKYEAQKSVPKRTIFVDNGFNSLLWYVKDIILSHQPTRFIAKSVRNLFFPSVPRVDPRHIIAIEVSSVCDAKCVFCNYKSGYRKMNIASLEWFESIARSSVAFGYRHLDLTPLTGELFTNKNAIEIIRAAKKAGFETISTFTNAIQLHRFDIDGLLLSGINHLYISTPGFSDELYESVFGVRKYQEFKKSIMQLLEAHRRLNSTVEISFEPRSYLTKNKMQRSEFYSNFIAGFVGEKIYLSDPMRVFDTWGGDITRRDMIGTMKLDWNSLKSIYPLKKSYPCERLYQVGVQVNGDVRLCNCRYDSSIETERDSLRIDSLKNHPDFESLMKHNAEKIRLVRENFRNGILPALCKKCPFYSPVQFDRMETTKIYFPKTDHETPEPIL